MEHVNYWTIGTRNQWLFNATDNSSLESLAEKIDPSDVYCSDGPGVINLGIHRINGRLYAGNYVGVCRLRDINGKNLQTSDGRDVILKVRPRFSLSVVDMLNFIRNDDEFERYLAPQTMRVSCLEREVDDLISNELFHFFSDEDPIFLQDDVARESSVITASIFVSLLYNLCKRPLMGRTVTKEENLVGKAKGKIEFSKNIRFNTIKGRDDRLFCRYLQYTEDIIENQILKAALKKSCAFLNQYFQSVSGRKNSFRDMISYCNNSLSHITYKKISRHDLKGIKTTGVYVSYKPVVNAAKMVLNEITMSSKGESAITSYVIPYAISMEKLFEMYIRAYLKQAGVKTYDDREPGIKILQYDNKTPVLTENSSSFANYIKGNVKPDIIIYNPETKKYAVFDVKYKDSSSSRFSRPDRMQILAYALIFDCNHVGNIFPTQNGNGSIFYKYNKINSSDEKVRFYHQIEIAIEDHTTFMMSLKSDDSSISILDYLKQLLA